MHCIAVSFCINLFSFFIHLSSSFLYWFCVCFVVKIYAPSSWSHYCLFFSVVYVFIHPPLTDIVNIFISFAFSRVFTVSCYYPTSIFSIKYLFTRLLLELYIVTIFIPTYDFLLFYQCNFQSLCINVVLLDFTHPPARPRSDALWTFGLTVCPTSLTACSPFLLLRPSPSGWSLHSHWGPFVSSLFSSSSLSLSF